MGGLVGEGMKGYESNDDIMSLAISNACSSWRGGGGGPVFIMQCIQWLS